MAKLTGRPIFADQLCKGCELCASVCPKKILRLSARHNSRGYKVAECLDDSACIACGFCTVVCPDCAISIVSEEE